MDAKITRRARTKTQNRETILAAARQVFAEMGFAAATVRDVIRATPLASGTFYNYFKSKEEVYQALRDELALALRPQLRAARQAAQTAEEFLFTGYRLFFAFVLERAATPGNFRMDSPEVLMGFAELREDLEEAVSRGLFPPLDSALFSSAIVGLGFELADRVKTGTDPDRAARFATQLLLGGLPAVSA